MRSCPECHVLVPGPDTLCPLCGSVLKQEGGNDEVELLYPDFSQPIKPRSRFPMLAKIFAFISLITILICGFLNLILSHELSWSLYVIGGIIGAWTSVGLHLLTDVNLNYKLLCDLCSLSLYLILIDWLTGWSGWSVDYVIPILYIGIMITTVILAVIFREFWREYILSLVAVCVLGLGPLLIFFSGESPIRYLCLAAALLAGVLLIGLFFFTGSKLFSEWRRRMNI